MIAVIDKLSDSKNTDTKEIIEKLIDNINKTHEDNSNNFKVIADSIPKTITINNPPMEVNVNNPPMDINITNTPMEVNMTIDSSNKDQKQKQINVIRDDNGQIISAEVKEV